MMFSFNKMNSYYIFVDFRNFIQILYLGCLSEALSDANSRTS